MDIIIINDLSDQRMAIKFYSIRVFCGAISSTIMRVKMFLTVLLSRFSRFSNPAVVRSPSAACAHLRFDTHAQVRCCQNMTSLLLWDVVSANTRRQSNTRTTLTDVFSCLSWQYDCNIILLLTCTSNMKKIFIVWKFVYMVYADIAEVLIDATLMHNL